MKKYVVLGFILFFMLSFMLLLNDNSYAYVDDNNLIIYPKEVTTINLKKYLNKNNYSISSFCSYEKCYEIREKDINMSISNFHKLYDKDLCEEDALEIKVKGYPVSKIILNN